MKRIPAISVGHCACCGSKAFLFLLFTVDNTGLKLYALEFLFWARWSPNTLTCLSPDHKSQTEYMEQLSEDNKKWTGAGALRKGIRI